MPNVFLTEIQVQNAFPLAWSRLPKVFREQEGFRFQLTEEGTLLYLWDSAPKDHTKAFWFDRKARKWNDDVVALFKKTGEITEAFDDLLH